MVSSVPKNAESRASSVLCNVLRAADEADTGHAEAVALEGPLRRGDDVRVVRQPEVVVGAEVEHLTATLDLDEGALRRGDDALLLEEAALHKFGRLGAEVLKEGGVHKG